MEHLVLAIIGMIFFYHAKPQSFWIKSWRKVQHKKQTKCHSISFFPEMSKTTQVIHTPFPPLWTHIKFIIITEGLFHNDDKISFLVNRSWSPVEDWDGVVSFWFFIVERKLGSRQSNTKIKIHTFSFRLWLQSLCSHLCEPKLKTRWGNFSQGVKVFSLLVKWQWLFNLYDGKSDRQKALSFSQECRPGLWKRSNQQSKKPEFAHANIQLKIAKWYL